jgi:hypothetical protein
MDSKKPDQSSKQKPIAACDRPPFNPTVQCPAGADPAPYW